MLNINTVFQGMVAGVTSLTLGAPTQGQIPTQELSRAKLASEFDLKAVPDYMRCEAAIAIAAMPEDSRVSFDSFRRDYGASYKLTVQSGDYEAGRPSQFLAASWNKFTDEPSVSLRLYYSSRSVLGNMQIIQKENVFLDKKDLGAPQIGWVPPELFDAMNGASLYIRGNFSSYIKPARLISHEAAARMVDACGPSVS